MIFLVLLFLASFTYGLQTSYLYVGISYARGFCPFYQVVEQGKTGVCGCAPMFDAFAGAEDDSLSAMDKTTEWANCQNNCWGGDSIINMTSFVTQMALVSNRYYQASRALDDGSLYQACPTEVHTGIGVQISVPVNQKLVRPDGSVVGDELCLGEQFRVSSGDAKGEVWQDGGVDDSPPIEWVPDVEAVFEKVIDYDKSEEYYLAKGVSTSSTPEDGFVDPVTGIRMHTMDVGGNVYNESQGTISPIVPWTGSLICSLKDKGIQASNAKKTGDWYAPAALGRMDFSAESEVECMYLLLGATFYYGDGSPLFIPRWKPYVLQAGPNVDPNNWMDQTVRFDSKSDFFKVGTVGINKTLRVVDSPKPKAEISIAGSENIVYGQTNTLRVHINNSGGINISIKSVYSTPSGKLVSCDTLDLAAGQQAECLFTVTPVQGQGLSIQVSYDYKSCGRSQVGLVTKTLIDSKTIRPSLKEQSYLMGVHGACDNSYYSCYSASEGALFAGYKCFKTSNGFYAPATERFNLRFDVSDVPKDVQIIGATLHLKASDIGKSQTVQVYSVDKIPEAVKCLPGGDICTQPYCGECKPLYDIDGTVASSTEISSTGQYSFNLTNQLKDKMAGDGIVSLQIRGAEGLWESQGQSSCSVENEWDKRDVSFDAGGRDGPYLEIVYR